MGRLRIVRTLVLAAALLVSPVLAAEAPAQDNSAVAVNTKDGSSVFKFAFSIKKVASDVVDPQNAAVAFSSCDGCETVAIAIQVVLVSGDPDVVAPENVAIAYNEDCNVCATLAMAYQFVFGTGDEPVHFTKEGKERLHQIKKQFKELKHADLPLEEVERRVHELALQVNEIVRNELVAGPPGQVEESASSSTSSTTSPSTTPPSTTTTTEDTTATTEAPATTTPSSTTSTTTA